MLKGKQGLSLQQQLMNGEDHSWTADEAIARSKTLKPLFEPGRSKKTHYSDTNYQLLGKIIEQITGKTIEENYHERLFKPLGLSHTYLYTDITDVRPQHLYYKKHPLNIPKAKCSFRADGGIVSTAEEMLVFNKAFFGGSFFQKDVLNKSVEWNKIFFPLRAGPGIHLFKLAWYLDPMQKFPVFIGHSGLSGALSYYNAENNLYISCTVNQIAYPDSSFKLMIKLVSRILKS